MSDIDNLYNNEYEIEKKPENFNGDFKVQDKKNQNIFYKISGFLFLIILLLGIGYFLPQKENFEKENEEQVNLKEFFLEVSFEGIEIKAKSVFVYDALHEKIIFEKNSNVQLPLASITKIMLAYVASDLLPRDEIIAITKKDIEKDGDSGFFINEEWFFEDLLEYTLISSSNDGASAIAGAAEAVLNKKEGIEREQNEGSGLVDRAFFVKKMNEKSVELGLSQTFFLNSTGLDKNKYISGGYGSARDVAYLFSEIIDTKPWILELTIKNKLRTSSNGVSYETQNTNSIINKIPCLIGTKTGFTDLAGGNLAIAFDAGINHPIIAVVLGSTYEGRFEDIDKIVDTVLDRERY